LTRDLFIRHLMYLLPSLATLAGLALVPLLIQWRQLAGLARRHDAPSLPATVLPTARLGGALAAALLAALALPWTYANVVLGLESETATARLADFIALVTPPDALVFGDFSELNFYARRPTSYEGASMSAGAAASGQLAWSVVSPRFAERRPALLVNLSAARHDVGHLQYMPDYADYLAWIDQHYVKLGSFERDWQSYLLYEPKDAPLPRLARYADGPSLLAARPDRAEARAGEAVEVLTAWQNGAPEEPLTEYAATLRLVDPIGRQWAQQDSSLFAYPDRKSPRWAADELTSQRLGLTLPPDLPPGAYRLEVGLYRRNGADVPQLDPGGQPVYVRALAGTIQVLAGQARDIPDPAPDVVRAERSIGALTLLGHGQLPTDPVYAGDTLPLDLWWRLDGEPVDPPVRLWVGLEGERASPSETGVATRGGLEQDLGVALAALPRGVVYHQRAYAAVPIDQPAGAAELQVDLLDAAGRAGSEAPVVLGTITVAAAPEADRAATDVGPDSSSASLFRAGDLAAVTGVQTAVGEPGAAAAFGGRIRLDPGDPVAVSLRWRALRRTEGPWSFSLQLLDASGLPVAQVDGPAGGWERPSTAWRAGERIEQQLTLALPPSLAAGSYPLILALYNPATGYRAPLQGQGTDGDHVVLSTVDVARP
ncbi:MAG: hypothetical protein KDH92_09685, partial [Chloroflexi bacterium]|nr:hypothetical protein [Chloroflexota bacterium]